MSTLWAYFWPMLGAGLVIGIVAGAFGFRPRGRRYTALGIGVAATLAAAALWHGPAGGAERFSAEVERGIRKTLAYYEMTEIDAHLQRRPLTRTVVLSGRADEFQRTELGRLVAEVPGVAEASWSKRVRGIPLIAEGAGVALLGFLLGLLVAYLVELRRRYNAQWKW